VQYGLVEENDESHARLAAGTTRLVTATSMSLGTGILRKMFMFAA
jgi:hypothetical protein